MNYFQALCIASNTVHQLLTLQVGLLFGRYEYSSCLMDHIYLIDFQLTKIRNNSRSRRYFCHVPMRDIALHEATSPNIYTCIISYCNAITECFSTIVFLSSSQAEC